MKDDLMEVSEIKRKVLPVLKKVGVKRAGVFGSFARGDYKKDSDVDLLVQVSSGTSLLDFVKIEFELQDVLGRNVELLTYKSLNPLLKKSILSEEVKIL